MTNKIEKDIPVPATTRLRKYPFADMQPGDSVFFPGEDINSRPYRAAMTLGKRRGWKFVARRERNGIRIWRAE